MVIPRFSFSAAAGVALLLALAACGGGGEDAPPSAAPPPAGLQPTLASIQANVFTPSCAKSGCHAGATAPFGLRLEPGLSWQNLYLMPSQGTSPARVIPLDPDGSFLIQKLEATLPIEGGRMPADGPPYLQQTTVDVIREWIQNGALMN